MKTVWLTPRTILVVDEHPGLIARCREELAFHDYGLLVARNLDQAVRLCHQQNIALALIDVGQGQVADVLRQTFSVACAFMSNKAPASCQTPVFQRKEPLLLDLLIAFLNDLVPVTESLGA